MLKIPKTKRAGKVTQEVESLPSKHEAKFKSQYNNNNNNNKVKTELGMVEHSCNPITWKKVHEFKANLGYTANSRPAWAIQEDLLSKKKNVYIWIYKETGKADFNYNFINSMFNILSFQHIK
jgi:hypothetical protein